MFYTVFVFFLLFLSLKLLFKELTYKFLVDYLAKNRIYKIKNIKFLDLFLNNIISKGFRFFFNNSIYGNIFIKSKNYNRLIFLILFFFIIL